MVVTTLVINSCVSWDIMLCSPGKVNRRFGGTYRLHLQDFRVNQTPPSTRQVLPAVSHRRRRTFTGLHGVMSQMRVHV
jgi:hypothetical protein